jgi:hypothetical protein
VQKKCFHVSEKRFKLDYHPTPGEIEEYCSPLNLNPMVQVETSQLTAECINWRDALRQHREDFTRNKVKLQQAANSSLSKEQLLHVEHLHNQFHIQLINIHDLKHTIKTHCKRIEFENNQNNEQLNEDTVATHEILFSQFQDLDLTLQELNVEFNIFLRQLD